MDTTGHNRENAGINEFRTGNEMHNSFNLSIALRIQDAIHVLCMLSAAAYSFVMRHFETGFEAQWLLYSLAYGWLEGST
jgi:hypothetical protein